MPDAGTLLRYCTHKAADMVMLHAEGEIDLSTVSSFQDALVSAFAEGRHVITDLSRVEYLDGTGIRVLHDAARMNPGRLVVVVPRPNMRRLFEILNLLETLPVMSTLAAAREHLQSRGSTVSPRA
ncbi:MAG TPA: STAS domain-containing protein [Tepidiformaceae bacterium]|nr:STAS domain-containing protein [Tepidiformaceae bacterium]